jgi:hypothetical protein
MLLITEDATLKCAHGGTVKLEPIQQWVTIEKRVILVEGDPLNRAISACPMATPMTPPCRKTVSVDSAASYSVFVTVDGLRVCLDKATGTTDWAKLGTVPYNVTRPGQNLVTIGS